MKEYWKDLALRGTPLFHCFLMAVFALTFGVLPIVLVIFYMKTLGILWLPLVMVYWLLLSVAARQVFRLRELRKERFLYGDELFFQLYPRLKRAEERKMRREAERKRHPSRPKRGRQDRTNGIFE